MFMRSTLVTVMLQFETVWSHDRRTIDHVYTVRRFSNLFAHFDDWTLNAIIKMRSCALWRTSKEACIIKFDAVLLSFWFGQPTHSVYCTANGSRLFGAGWREIMDVASRSMASWLTPRKTAICIYAHAHCSARCFVACSAVKSQYSNERRLISMRPYDHLDTTHWHLQRQYHGCTNHCDGGIYIYVLL